jgi:hypothetical protein
MSETASGFNQYVGDDSEIKKGKHLGKILKSVPKEIEWAVLDRMKEDEEYAQGGSIPNNYEGRTPEDIWNNLTKPQRSHFLYDHVSEIEAYKNIDRLPSREILIAHNSDWETLDKDIKNRFANHTREGQYAYGGKTKSRPSMRELYIDEIASLTGTRNVVGIKNFVDENKLTDSELSNLTVGIGRGMVSKSDFVTALVGNKNNPIQKEVIAFAKSGKAYKMAEGGEISIYNLRKGDKVKTRKGDIETIIRRTGSGSYETIENDYTHSPESLKFVSRPSRKMADGGFMNNVYAEGGEIGDMVSIELNNGKVIIGKLQKTNPIKIRTNENSTQVIPNALIKSIKKSNYADGGFMNNVYAEGGKVKSRKKRNDELDALTEEEYKVWNKIGARSGGQIRGNEMLLKNYAEGIEEVMQKKGIAKASFNQDDYDYLTDNNYHLLNEFLIFNGYYDSKVTNNLKGYMVEAYNEEVMENGKAKYYPNPSVITVSSFADGGFTDNEEDVHYDFGYGDKLDLGGGRIRYFKEWDGDKMIVVDSRDDLDSSKGSYAYPSNVKSVIERYDEDEDEDVYARGGSLGYEVMIDGNYDEPKKFSTFSLAKKWILQNIKKHDSLELVDSYGDSIFVEGDATKEDLDYLFSNQEASFKKGGAVSEKLDKGVYRVGKPTKVSTNLYEQKIVEIFDNGDISTASDYGRKLGDFKSQKYPIITKEQLDAQYKMADGGFMNNVYAEGGGVRDYMNTPEYKEMVDRMQKLTYDVKGRVVRAIGLDRAIEFYDIDYPVRPYQLIEKAVRSGFITLDEINERVIDSALETAQDSEEDEEVGSSDFTAYLHSFLNDAGFKVGFVKNHLTREYAEGGGVDDNWELRNEGDGFGSILHNGKKVDDYEWDRDAMTFWVSNPMGGQKSIDTPQKLFNYYKAKGYADGGMFDDNDGFMKADNNFNYRYPQGNVHVDTIDESIDLTNNMPLRNNKAVVESLDENIDLNQDSRIRAKLSYEPKNRTPEKMMMVNQRMVIANLPKPTSKTHKND